jgi:hypothetical protein
MKENIVLDYKTRKWWYAEKHKLPIYEHTNGLRKITIHHTAVHNNNNNNNQKLKKKVKSHQSFHLTEKKWNDICYHYLISKDGKIIEGRNIKYIANPDYRSGKEKEKKYDLDGIILVCLMGNFEEEKLEEKQKNTLIHFLCYLIQKHNINTKEIYIHSNTKEYDIKNNDGKIKTLCPGKDIKEFYDKGEIKKNVESNLKKKFILNKEDNLFGKILNKIFLRYHK